jgi:HEAT repeat protein
MLVQCLGLRDGVVAFLASDTLQKIGAPASAEVVKLFDDPSDETRRRAAELLGKLPPDPTGEPKILEALGRRVEGDKAWIVRGEAAGALGARGARQTQKGYALGVLVRALGDQDEAVAAAAVKALGALGEPRAIPRLVDALERAAARGQVTMVKPIQAALAQLSNDPLQRDVNGWRAWWRAKEGELTQPPKPGSGR